MRLTILEPTATPKLRVSLSLTETVTAVACSKNKVSIVMRMDVCRVRTCSIADNGKQDHSDELLANMTTRR